MARNEKSGPYGRLVNSCNESIRSSSNEPDELLGHLSDGEVWVFEFERGFVGRTSFLPAPLKHSRRARLLGSIGDSDWPCASIMLGHGGWVF